MRVIQKHRASLALPALRVLSFGGPYPYSCAFAHSMTASVALDQMIFAHQWPLQQNDEPCEVVAGQVTLDERRTIEGHHYEILDDDF